MQARASQKDGMKRMILMPKVAQRVLILGWMIASIAIFATTQEESLPADESLTQSDSTPSEASSIDDFAWLWQYPRHDQEAVENPFHYLRREETLIVPSEAMIQRWSQWGALYAKLRRENRLHLVSGIWSEDALVQSLNSLVMIPEEELKVFAEDFSQELWSQRSEAFVHLFLPILQEYFQEQWPSEIQNVQDLEQWWLSIGWPSTWLSRSIMNEQEWQMALHQQDVWREILLFHHEEIRNFLHESMSIMTKQMSASIVYHWLYQPASVWEIYTRQDAIQMIYSLYMSFYEVLQLWHDQALPAYVAYIRTLPFDDGQKVVYIAQLQENMQNLLAIFYDQKSYKNFIRERNRWMFKNNQRDITQYQEELMQIYAWLWTSQERREQAKDAYWQAYLDQEMD
ncbi:hypothetical protein PVA45_08035 (plasmid) [Entomospira entomophila]|uniref:Uncharacterized protein n=1 Tax=Entomospira entomophila TaxID=2719988 RepID=A0A968GE99_9SPIO|nr:hypothetical protein [Entomospira entomophilus]NIZ41454.1 hypothetical protein [Entomospira entomophilus]WDI36288.1 hypothetical protein PVA45_08035 [Entomospira entomophilus]